MIPERLVLATANPGKVRELGALIARWGPVGVVALDAFPGLRCPEETGDTYQENAIAKATAIAAAAGLPALGDDSGLEVDALGGAPGVHSARWAGSSATDADRIAKLLVALRDVPDAQRGARFRCVVALAWPDGRVETAAGECAGTVAAAPRGAGGFGYDPVFICDELGYTFGEATTEDKHRLSHRARALRALGERLATLRAGGRPC
jgi:XTP/dITP diphosphohydrolase